MLGSLVSFVNLAGSGVYYLLSYSFKTGRLLVSGINWLVFCLSQILRNLFAVFSTISESVSVFLQDVAHYLQQIFNFILGTCDGLLSGFIVVYLKLTSSLLLGINCISLVANFLVQGLLTIYHFVIQTCILAKHIVVLFGSGVWFLVTLPPLLLYYGYILGLTFIRNLVGEVWDICHGGLGNLKSIVYSIIEFVMDVPLESLAGLAVALSVGYVVAQFYVVIGLYVKRQLRMAGAWTGRQYTKFQRTVYLVLERRRRARSFQVPRQQPTNHSAGRPSSSVPMNAKDSSLSGCDMYCVICQERNKCVLLLPCKHVCLCSECTSELRYYNDICPICRTNIESTTKVYM